ncbi:MAG TPA: cyclopropane fatty acyl phospholipid synthase [Gammaproteobacteria bacterium]
MQHDRLHQRLESRNRRPVSFADFFRERVQDVLARADVRVQETRAGVRPWDIQVNDSRFYRRALLQGSLGLGESYMDGWWDCERLDELFVRLLRAGLDTAVSDWHRALLSLRTRLFNLQTRSRAFRVGEQHYDLGNELFEQMLDARMIYSCGYWKEAADLDAAQEAKLDLVARKLDLAPGMRVLDIGCGWGGAVAFLAERYGVEAVGLTVSKQQAEHATRRVAGLPVDIRLQDYREIDERFDRVFSIGMFEHVGHRNYATYMDVVRRCLHPDGLFVLHSIGRNDSTTHTDPWIARYIFPNSMLPSIAQIGAVIENRFVMEDWQNFGPDYERTLHAWHDRFEKAELPARYDERFRRMWRYYLMASAAGFRARRLQLWQLVLSPAGRAARYDAPR